MTNVSQYAKNIAVIGAGYWGKNLVRNFYELGSLHTICDSETRTLLDFSNKYPGLNTTADFEEVLENQDIEGVVIALPAEHHFSYAKKVLTAGKNVYVEKPLALEIKEAQALVAMAEQKGLILMVGHLLQYHPAFVRLKELVHRGELGKLNYIYSNRLSLGKIRREENILWSFAPHDISMILALCREEPLRVSAFGGNYLQKKIADVTVTQLEFKSGIKCHIFVSWLHPFKEQKLVVVGDKKMAVFSDTEEWENKLLIYSHSITWDKGIPVANKAAGQSINVEKSEPLKNECRHFLECIKNKRRPLTDGQEGLKVLRVLQACSMQLAQNSLEIKEK